MIHPSARADRGDILILGGHVDVDDRAPVAVVEPGIAGLVGHRRRGAAHEIEHFLIEDQRLVERGGADIDMADAVDHEIKPPTIRPSACRVGASALSCVLPSRTRTMAWCVPGSCGSAPVPAMTNWPRCPIIDTTVSGAASGNSVGPSESLPSARLSQVWPPYSGSRGEGAFMNASQSGAITCAPSAPVPSSSNRPIRPQSSSLM